MTVPQGAKALQVNLSGVARRARCAGSPINPYGVPVESTSSLVCFTNFSARSCNSTSRAYANPLPGIWELEVEARRTTPTLVNPFTIAAAVQGVIVDPASQTLASVTAGQPTPVSWTVTNTLRPGHRHAEGGTLGSAVSERKTIANHETQEFTVVVPAGATRLTATIGKPSDQGADLDLFVLRGGAIVAQQADGDSEESVTITNPVAATYTVRVDGYAVPAGTAYDYLDVFFSPALGSFTVPATALDLAPGASAPVTGQITANAAPAAGRQLFGEMRVLSGQGAVLGTGSVVVGRSLPRTAPPHHLDPTAVMAVGSSGRRSSTSSTQSGCPCWHVVARPSITAPRTVTVRPALSSGRLAHQKPRALRLGRDRHPASTPSATVPRTVTTRPRPGGESR